MAKKLLRVEERDGAHVVTIDGEAIDGVRSARINMEPGEGYLPVLVLEVIQFSAEIRGKISRHAERSCTVEHIGEGGPD